MDVRVEGSGARAQVFVDGHSLPHVREAAVLVRAGELPHVTVELLTPNGFLYEVQPDGVMLLLLGRNGRPVFRGRLVDVAECSEDGERRVTPVPEQTIDPDRVARSVIDTLTRP